MSFALGQPVDDPRIVEVVEPRPGRWMHHMIVQTESDLSEDVKGWLTQAFEFAA